MKRVEFIHRTTKEKVSGYQYIQGVHPPPPDVTVTMGLGGVVARVDTVRGSDTDLNSTDWILMWTFSMRCSSRTSIDVLTGMTMRGRPSR